MRILTLLIVIFGSLLATFAQQSPATPTRLALEVTYYAGRKPAFQTVPGQESKPNGAWYGMFGHTTASQPLTEPVEAVRILSHVEGDAVRVYVSTLSGRKALENEQQVGTYLLRETEKITIDDLKQFGVEPFAIKLIRVTPNIAPVPPVVFKGVQSLTLVSATSNEATLPSYKVTVTNQSNKDVVAIAIEVVTGDQIQISGRPQSKEGEPLIAAGKTHDLWIRAPSRAATTVDGYVPTTPSNQQIVIKAAMFGDGSYEGSAAAVAAFSGYRAGEKMELPRVVSSLDRALDTAANLKNEGVADSIRNLEAELSALSSDAEPATVQRINSEFPNLDNPERSSIKESLEFSATMIKTNLIKELKKLESEQLDVTTYRLWLTNQKEKHATWLAKL